jgi:hypothetical protein
MHRLVLRMSEPLFYFYNCVTLRLVLGTETHDGLIKLDNDQGLNLFIPITPSWSLIGEL